MDWDALDIEPITRTLIGSLADDGPPPLGGLVAGDELGGMTRLIADVAVDVADYLWGHQKDCREPLWSVADVLSRLGLSKRTDAALVAHVAAALELRRRHWQQANPSGTTAESVKRALRLRPRSGPRRPSRDVVGATHEFRRQGEMWVVTFDGTTIYLKDALGPAYIAHLVASPHRTIAAVELHATVAGAKAPRAGSAGDLADEQTRQDIKQRCLDLQDELEQARCHNDESRQDRIQAELDKLTDYLLQVEGFGGRARRASDDADRIRRSVLQAIRRTTKALDKHLPAAGRHLDSAIRTGLFLSYQPEQELPWVL